MRSIIIHVLGEPDKIRGRGAATGKGRQSEMRKQRALGREMALG